MNALERYLEAAKIEELTTDLVRQGYSLMPTEIGGRTVGDIVAVKNGRTIAFEVKARSRLGEVAKDVSRHRQDAMNSGVDDFRLVIVNPPAAVEVEIEGLAGVLARHLADNVPANLKALAGNTEVRRVSGCRVQHVSVTLSDIRVVGYGGVNVALEYGTGSPPGGVTLSETFPFDFDIILRHDLTLDHVNRLDVDVSSFTD